MRGTCACAALAAMGLLLENGAAAPARKFVCGTPDAPPGATGPKDPGAAGIPAKSADLPRIVKVYSGKPPALMVRVAFSDEPYPIGTATLDRINDTVNTMFRAMSRNTFEFTFKHYPAVLQAPGSAASYGGDFNSLKSFIDGALRDGGYAKDAAGDKGYSVYVATFPEINVGWGGLSYGPSSGAHFVTGDYTAGYAVHELGHGIGLPHSSSIEAGNDIFGTPGNAGQHVEYGDIYDIMGWGWPLNTHYNANYKWRLGWLDQDEAAEIRNSGVYRLYAHDNPLHSHKMLGIRVPSTDTRYAYWFEYRGAYPGARPGAVVMFEGFRSTNQLSAIHIMDLTPGSRSNDDFEDAVMVPGKELKDKYGTATFKTIAINSGTWDQDGWVDLQVTLPGTAVFAPGRNPLVQGGGGVDVMGRTLGAWYPAAVLRLGNSAGGAPR